MDHRTILRRLAVRDDALVESLLSAGTDSLTSGLDERARALVRIGALVAVDAGVPSYLSAVELACAAGATPDEIVDALVAVMPIAGVPRVVAAAPRLALALGYDVPAALESIDAPLLGP
jgi:alkylhydroperoxidase/carboxymuconolactone decarboxylase family protein YurZ